MHSLYQSYEKHCQLTVRLFGGLANKHTVISFTEWKSSLENKLSEWTVLSQREKNKTWKMSVENQTNGGSYWLILVTSIGLLSSILCLLYIIFKLTLNKMIKAILCIMAVHNLIALLLMTVSNSIMIAYDLRTWYTCMLFLQPGFLLIWSNCILSSLISAIR